MLDPSALLPEDESADEFREQMESIREAPGDRLLAFAFGVFFAHVGLLAASLGLMLVGIRGQWRIGGALVVVGVLALVATVWVVQRHRASH